MRSRRALAAGVSTLCVSLVFACAALALRKTGGISEGSARAVLSFLGVLPLIVATAGFSRRLDAQPGRAGAIALDRFHGLADRLSSALSFAREAAPTAFMAAAIDDAIDRVPSVDPKRAVPIHAPPHLVAACVLVCAFAAIDLFEVRHHTPAAHVQTIDAVDVTADDLDAMREFLDQMKSRDQTDEAKAATREFNQLIEDLAARRLDRTEAFRRMQQLEDKLLLGREADAKALEDAMKKIGDEMKAAELTKPAGEALASKNLAAAEKQLQELAKKLREQEGKQVDKAQLEKMRDALKRASGSQSKRQEQLAQRREELRQQLLAQRNKRSDGGADDEERSLLQKRERELERLDRETEQSEATGRQLDRLDRELAKAAEDLMKDLGLSAQDLEKSAEDINRMKQQEMTQEEKEQLRQKLEELREMMRQQGQGGQGQMARLRRFQMQARGKGGGSRGEQEGGQDGQEGQQAGQGQQGQGQQGQGQQGEGQGSQGSQRSHSAGGNGGETWVLGPNGQRMLMLSQGRGGGGEGAGGPPAGGKGWGTAHDGHVEGKATGGLSSNQDTQVAGQDTGQGGSRSEVIEGAAERGFASRGYQKVFREYQTVAEEALAKDEIPGGYRFYVRRYFELIRPRDEHEAAPSANEGSPPAARP